MSRNRGHARPPRESEEDSRFASARLWDASIAAAKVSVAVVLLCTIVSLPRLELYIGSLLATLIPEPVVRFFNSDAEVVDPATLRAFKDRVIDGFEEPEQSAAAPKPRRTFGLGSSRQEVLAIQGQPSGSSQNVMRYGSSEVYFVADRVVGWHDSSTDPLDLR